MPLTDQQLSAISVTERICSSISLLCASTVIGTFVSNRAFRKPINCLILRAGLANIVLNIATLISRAGLEHGTESFLCQFQAFLVQWFVTHNMFIGGMKLTMDAGPRFYPADALWALCIAFNVYLRLLRQYNSDELQRLEWRYMVFCYVVPSVPAFVLLFIESPERGKAYGDAVFECWISLQWNALRIALLYAPIWLILTIIFAIYGRVGRYIFLEIKQLRELGIHGDWSQHVNWIADTSPTERYQLRPSPTSLSQIQSRSRTGAIPTQQQIDTLSDDVGFIGAQSSLNMAAWAYVRYAFLFFTALMITWCPSSVNRVSTFINPKYQSFTLNLFTAFVIPLQGFWNSLIYFSIAREELKALFGQRP